MAASPFDAGTEERGISLDGVQQLVLRHTTLVAVVTLGGLGASLGLLAKKPPVYRAKATLILDSDQASGGILGDLAALTSAPMASSEMEILRSRTTAEQVVQELDPERAERAARERHLGLTTLVEDPSLAPLGDVLRGSLAGAWTPGTRLEARLVPGPTEAAAAPRPDAIRVHFPAPDRVSLSLPRSITRPLESDLGVESFALVPGRAIAYAGWSVELYPEADLTGHSYIVHHLEPFQAVNRVLAATRVRETERNSGVIQLTYEDSDPRRAAETANALCRNYLDRNKDRAEMRASRTADFISGQLEAQIKLLHDAESEVVSLKAESPRTIDIGETAKATIEKLSALELQRVQNQLQRVSVDQALALVRQGETEALSRLSAEISDPITLSYVTEIARLSAEFELQERSDAGVYKGLLQARNLEAQERLDSVSLELGSARAALEAVLKGGPEAASRLGAGESVSGDPLLRGYLEELSILHGRRDALAAEFTSDYPELAAVEGEIESIQRRVTTLFENRVAGLEDEERELGRLLAGYEERSDSYPEDERALIASALEQLRRRTTTHLQSRLAGIDSLARSLEEEIERIESDLGTLPESERTLADPMRRLEAHTGIVQFLLARQQEAEISRAATIASAEFIDPAVPPLGRYGPSIPLHVAMGLFFGLACALGLAFLRESLKKFVFTSAELESVTKLAVFGLIPDFKSGRCRVKGVGDKFVPLIDDPEGPIAEAFRSLRANLKFALGSIGNVKTFAATSCTKGEGKSTTNIGLALAFASAEKKVLLVDADMRGASVNRYLKLDLSPGLSDVLTEKLSWRECVHRNVAEGLDVITAGKQPRSPGDLLDSRVCGDLLEELGQEYDLIVVDVPPALAVADLDGFASRLDALLLLCKSNKMPGVVVGAAANRLRQVGANLIGAALNAVGSSRANTPYGSEYGYGYGYGYGHEAERSRKRALR